MSIQEAKQKAIEQPLASPNQSSKDISNWKLLLIGLGFAVLSLGLSFLIVSYPTAPLSPETQAKQTEAQAKQAEIRARQDFASKLYSDRGYVYSAQGEDKKVLDIGVVKEIPPYLADSTVEYIITDELKKNAKALGFTHITMKGGRKSFTYPDTINKTVYLP